MPIYSPQTSNPFEDATEISSVAQEDFVLLNDGTDDLQKSAIANLPFASTAHGHEIDDITGLEIALSDKATINHGHPITDIDGLVSVLDGKASAIHSHSISDVTNLQTTLDDKVGSATLANTVSALQQNIDGKANASHTQAINTITGLQIALDSKANSTDLTNLQTSLNNKSNIGHTHQISDVSGLQTALNSKLDIGTIINGFDYNQSSVPSNPTTGQTWRERDSNNWLVRDWFWDGVDWQSIQEFTTSIGQYGGQSGIVTTASSSTATDNFFVQQANPVFLSANNKGIYWIETCLHMGTNTPNDINNYWRLRPAYIHTGTSSNLGGTDYFTSELGTFVNIEKWISHKKKIYRQQFLDTALNGLRMFLRSFGSPGQLFWTSNTSYRLIR